MNPRLYRIAYRFLNARESGLNPFRFLNGLKYEDREKVIKFLKYNHQVKFI